MALALDTPLPTPAGWRRVGDLALGDAVFGANGYPVRIADMSRVWPCTPCLSVTTDPRFHVLCDYEQKWPAFSVALNSHHARARRLLDACDSGHRVFLAGRRRDAPDNAVWLTWRHEDELIVAPAGRHDVRAIRVASRQGVFLAGHGCLPVMSDASP